MENKLNVAFAAVDKYLEDNILKNVQKEVRGQEFIQYGDKNLFPQYIHDLYESVSTLKSIINGIADYTGGENITINLPQFQERINESETIEDVVRQIAIDIKLYGGFALNIVRNRMGGIAAIYNLDFRNIRSNKKNTKFYYSEDWSKSYGRVKTTVYPKFDIEGKDINSIYYFKIEKYSTYPNPEWGGSITSAECLKHIGEFHLNSLYNGLSSDYIVNFNAGTPADDVKEEIEENFSDKFGGFNNGSRTMLSFNPDVQHKTTVEAIPQSNFIDRYDSLYQTSVKDIFTSFRCHPALFGLPTENTGFNSQDLAEAFKIMNNTVILPLQKLIKRQFEIIFGEKEVITIKPLQVSFEDTVTADDSSEKTVK